MPGGTAVSCPGAPSAGPHSARRLTWESNANSSNSFTGFDAMGRVMSHNQITGGATYSFTYGYNLDGGLESEGYPSGRQISTCYDVAGRVSQVSRNTTTYASGVFYRLDGQMASATFANGLTETYGYSTDGRLQLNSIQTAKQNATPLLLLNFSYTGTAGNNGNLQSQTITALENVTGHGTMQAAHSQSYTYDGVNRLGSVSETEPTPPTGDTVQPWSMNFGFDAYGNQWTTTTPSSLEGSGPTQRTQFNQSKNQLQISGDTYYSAGQLKTDPNLGTMTYYAGGQQYQYTAATGGNGAKYYYDPEGRRTQKVLSGTTTGTATFVYDAAGQLTAEYSNIANTDTGTQYLMGDHLGSTRLITDSSGNCLNQWDYFPFGGQISNALADGNREYQCSVTTGETLKFTGKERGVAKTEGALDYFGARYFSSDHGRWTSPDQYNAMLIKQNMEVAGLPTAAASSFFNGYIENPQNWNQYAYVKNNPFRFTDPTGTAPVDGHT